MRAIVITKPGGPEVLELREVEDPRPARGEVRVRVRATAVNRADLMQRMGAYPAPADSPQDIPGLEYAGEVDLLGEGVTDLALGDRVFGLVGGGAYAEAIVTHERAAARIPAQLSFVEAAAVPEAFITAYDAMVTQGRLAAGETVLIHAVGSGVGTAAVQIARAIGARSIGTARTASKIERAKTLGMDEGITVSNPIFDKEVKRLTSGRGVDLVLDLVGGNYVNESLLALALRGQIVIVGLVAGMRCDLDLALLMRKRITLIGTSLRSRPLEEKIAAMRDFARHVVPLFARGALKPVVDRVLPLASAAEAHAAMQSNEGFGKIVLEV